LRREIPIGLAGKIKARGALTKLSEESGKSEVYIIMCALEYREQKRGKWD
jgi:hypothetical protein